jgi:hypothetical protein
VIELVLAGEIFPDDSEDGDNLADARFVFFDSDVDVSQNALGNERYNCNISI